jgi:hypothetical protein
MASPRGQKVNRSILKSSQVSAARHWLPCNPLFAQAMQVEDAWRRPQDGQVSITRLLASQPEGHQRSSGRQTGET